MWHAGSSPGIEPGPPALEAWSLSHQGSPLNLLKSLICFIFFLSHLPECGWGQMLCTMLGYYRRRETYDFISVQFSSVAQSCPTLCDPHESQHARPPCPSPTPRVHSDVHRVSDAIQPSHPLSSPSPPAPNPSQHQSLFQ